MRDQIEFFEGDAFQLIPDYVRERNAAFFIDPPYTAGGKSAGSRLNAVSDLNHAALFSWMRDARGPVMMTYDDASEVRELARLFGFRTSRCR